MKKILIVDVPDDSIITGCDIWIEQFSDSYRKQSHITDYIEFEFPADIEIAVKMKDEFNIDNFKFAGTFTAGCIEGFERCANWFKSLLK